MAHARQHPVVAPAPGRRTTRQLLCQEVRHRRRGHDAAYWADFLDAAAGLRARGHQHLDIGQGEVDWDEFFDSPRENDFDGTSLREAVNERGKLAQFRAASVRMS